MIPVRMGSTRFVRKNYRLIGSVPIYEYTVLKAIESGCFDRIVINSEDPDLAVVADRLGVEFYLRSEELASSDATSDRVVGDFIANVCPDDSVVFWINTASPLSTIKDIKTAVDQLVNSDSESLVAVRHSRGHVTYKNDPVNFTHEGGFSKTQDMTSTAEFTYAIMGWKSSFLPSLENQILFDKNTIQTELSFWSTILLKNSEDYDLICRLFYVSQ